jgi:uncharacterized membrane protein
VNRLPFLDWTRGLAVLIMIQCHAFNSFARPEVRSQGAYQLSQFVGGMAAVLFLFLAGVTLAFQMDRLDRRGVAAFGRFSRMLRRAGYILGMAFLFRIGNSVFTIPFPPMKVLWKVDILNCMGLAMVVMAAAALFPPAARTRAAALAGIGIAFASPLASMVDWSGVPWLVRDYLAPDRIRFSYFPWASYLAFGLSAGAALRGMVRPEVENRMQWALIAGAGLILGGRYFSNLPYSLYAKSEFWLDSPALVLIRLGVILVILAAAFLWTEFGARPGWSWVQSLGKTSLMVYWVHVMLVYGWAAGRWKGGLTIPQTAVVTAGVIALMVALSAARLRWKEIDTLLRPSPARRSDSRPSPAPTA